MKSEEEKLRKDRLKKEFKRKEENAFIDSLPMKTVYFFDLFEVLDEKLKREQCDHTLRFTEHYLNVYQLPVQIVISWLNENGGYCDCEVLFNVEEKFENFK